MLRHNESASQRTMQMQNSPEVEQNPEAVFQGLGLRGWLKLVFTTRVHMIRQHDKLTDMMFEKLLMATKVATQARSAAQKFASLVLIQNEALVKAEKVLREDGDASAREEVLYAITEALTTAKSHL